VNKNTESTRYYSNLQESYIAKKFNGQVSPNSGASKFTKSDVILKKASMSVECKTSMTEKKSFSIQKEWLDKMRKEAWENRLSNACLAISFSPEGNENYFVIDEKLFAFLVEKLEEEVENG